MRIHAVIQSIGPSFPLIVHKLSDSINTLYTIYYKYNRYISKPFRRSKQRLRVKLIWQHLVTGTGCRSEIILLPGGPSSMGLLLLQHALGMHLGVIDDRSQSSLDLSNKCFCGARRRSGSGLGTGGASTSSPNTGGASTSVCASVGASMGTARCIMDLKSVISPFRIR